MYNIRLHLYFSPLREIKFFQKHNDSYYRLPLTETFYKKQCTTSPFDLRMIMFPSSTGKVLFAFISEAAA